MRVTGLHHIGISVEDLDRAIEQYCNLLGAEAGEIFVEVELQENQIFINQQTFVYQDMDFLL